MADWDLAFRETRPITYETCEGAVSAAVRGPTTIRIEAFQGHADPRDGGHRELTITADDRSGLLHVEVKLVQHQRGPGDPLTTTSIRGVRLFGPAAFATKLGTWHQLRDALAGIGCTDRTLAEAPAPIVDDAEAAGDTALAARLRAEITAALIAERAPSPIVFLRSPRADDIAAVLAARLEPERIDSVTLDDCQLSALPAGLARFPNLAHLSFVEHTLDGSALRGVALPKLSRLDLVGAGIRNLSRDDLAGFPALVELYLQDSQLQALDPDLIEAIPKLRRVLISRTPLARAAKKLVALRARWTGVVWK